MTIQDMMKQNQKLDVYPDERQKGKTMNPPKQKAP